MWNPTEDGKTHINIFSRGLTPLGRWMSNFAFQPIVTENGPFDSIEGYWYWLGNHDERLREVSGFAAKKLGKEIPKKFLLPEAAFRGAIIQAIRQKVSSNPNMKGALKESFFPFAHYYVFGNSSVPVVRDAGFGWITELWEELRKEIKSVT